MKVRTRVDVFARMIARTTKSGKVCLGNIHFYAPTRKEIFAMTPKETILLFSTLAFMSLI